MSSMGCDIHMYTEIFDGCKWVAVKMPSQYYKDSTTTVNSGLDVKATAFDGVYQGRNYTLFGILAGVRNPPPEEEIIDRPRGLPDDISDLINRESKSWGPDGHSHSWFTLAELLAYDWDREVILEGMVSQKTLKAYKEAGKLPEEWCQGTTDSTYTRLTWKEPVRHNAQDFVDITIPLLAKMGAPDKVRVVFWFDN